MAQQVAYRLLLAVPVLCGVLVFGFLLIKLAPGDPAMVIAGPSATPDVVERIRQDMGLDQPAIVQFWRYVTRVAQGDLGKSMINNTSVAAELVSAIGATAELMLACLALAVPAGIAMGTIAAVYQRGPIDRIVMAFSVAGVSMPVFFIGLLLMQYLGYKWQLLPFLGRGGPLWTVQGLRHAVLPALTLAFIFVGPVARMTRASVLDVLKADFVRTARAKGLRESTRRHPPCAEERADPGRHAGRPAGRLPAGRRGGDGEHLLLAGRRPSRGRRHPGERPAAGAGRHPDAGGVVPRRSTWLSTSATLCSIPGCSGDERHRRSSPTRFPQPRRAGARASATAR